MGCQEAYVPKSALFHTNGNPQEEDIFKKLGSKILLSEDVFYKMYILMHNGMGAGMAMI